MKQVTIDPDFGNFPDAQVNILFANGIDNHDTTTTMMNERNY